MNTSKIIKGVVGGGRYTVTAPIIKEDYGLYLQIEGVELPDTYQVDFSNDENSGTSVTMIGNADGVLIPAQFIKSGKDVFAFLYHVGENYGRTVYKFRIPNKVRPDRTNEEPTPEEQSVIDQAIGALNEAVAQTAQDVIDAETSAQASAESAQASGESALSASNSALSSGEYASNALGYAESASASASASAQSATQAQGYAQTAQDSAEEAQAHADSIKSLTATAQTLPDGSSATASYDAETGVMSFGIPKGKDGIDGDDGYSPTASVSKSGKVATITVTDQNGTTSAQIEDGTDGTDGYSPTVTITPITGGHRITIIDADGEHSADVMDGEDGNITDVQINGTSIVEDGVANVPVASSSNMGVVTCWEDGMGGISLGTNGKIITSMPTNDEIKGGITGYKPITPINQHTSAFYGLAKASGDVTQKTSDNPVGTYTNDAKASIQTMLGVPSADNVVNDVQIDGTSIVTNGVAEIPTPTGGNAGVVKALTDRGTTMFGKSLVIYPAGSGAVKAGTNSFWPITPSKQHESTFYGLAKVAGHDEKNSALPVGEYTEDAKSAISEMLGGSVSVLGTTPTIVAKSGIRYVCGEVATLDFTPSQTGICDVVFTSGSTPTVVTLPSTVKFPDGSFVAEADTTYEINILDGVYGAVMAWA